MLEPYQPKFEQQAAAGGGPGGAGHRSSCPIGTGIDSAVNTVSILIIPTSFKKQSLDCALINQSVSQSIKTKYFICI